MQAERVSITGSMLYDLVACPHRLRMDTFADPSKRDPVSPFVQLLWKKGVLWENEVMADLDTPFTDLSGYRGEEQELKTHEAMRRGDALIYAGRIRDGELLGVPDLLRREGAGYIAGDIKSGAGVEGSEDLTKRKKHYAVQLALYTDILERTGISAERRGFIWDIHGNEVDYDFVRPQSSRNPRTLWQEYEAVLLHARAILSERQETRAAYAAICKLCHWHSACVKQLKVADDLTLIPELGRTRRDVMMQSVPTVDALAKADPSEFHEGEKTIFRGIGPATLGKFSERARLLAAGPDARPYLKEPLELPSAPVELFFDIEVDPMRDHCYLHGFVERRNGDSKSERFVYFFAEGATEEAEKQAFAQAWEFMRASRPCAIYYYAPYEKTIYRKLRDKYSDVCSVDDLEALFDATETVDLYTDVVRKYTEWPTHDYSLKTLARYLGFDWQDTDPSGASSIEWFHQWTDTGDETIRQRILAYNEDDCRATRVLRDALQCMA
ncbi:MAG: TM0106 family RecB-like putative nuclease [Gammaproteobacteria bacterium]|nr:TM0106 family RecB-like putative nuclease [Gammaproteobacteria bacterium]